MQAYAYLWCLKTTEKLHANWSYIYGRQWILNEIKYDCYVSNEIEYNQIESTTCILEQFPITFNLCDFWTITDDFRAIGWYEERKPLSLPSHNHAVQLRYKIDTKQYFIIFTYMRFSIDE